MDYAGIGRLNMTLYLIVFTICVGITVAVFNPQTGDTYESSILDTGFADESSSAGAGGILEFFGFLWGLITGFLTFFLRALMVDIPFLPIGIKALIGAPMIILFIMLAIDYILEFSKNIQGWVESVKPF